ncbi:hypothetical protein [Simplicispira suum]|nr:hypothetical protein [Simplicispira suum]
MHSKSTETTLSSISGAQGPAPSPTTLLRSLPVAPLQEPEFICWEDSGLAGSQAALACALGGLQAQVADSILPALLNSELSAQLRQLDQSILERRLEREQLALSNVGFRIQAVLEVARRVRALFAQAPNAHILSEPLPAQLTQDLELAGIHWEGRVSLATWAAHVEAALRRLQRERHALELLKRELQEELELVTVQTEVGAVLATGAQHLLTHLQASDSSAPEKGRTQEHLQAHVYQPLGKDWYWLLDPQGENDGET